MRLISTMYGPNPWPGELKHAKIPSKKILDSQRAVGSPYGFLCFPHVGGVLAPGLPGKTTEADLRNSSGNLRGPVVKKDSENGFPSLGLEK